MAVRDSAALAVLLTLSVGSGRDLSLFVGLGMAVEHFRLRLGREAIRFFGWAVGAIRRIGLYRRSYPLALELFIISALVVLWRYSLFWIWP